MTSRKSWATYQVTRRKENKGENTCIEPTPLKRKGGKEETNEEGFRKRKGTCYLSKQPNQPKPNEGSLLLAAIHSVGKK